MSGILGANLRKTGNINRDYAFHARLSSDQGTPSSTPNHKVELDAMVGNFRNNTFDTGNNRFFVPITGKWQINYALKFNDNHTYFMKTKLKVNGSAIDQGFLMGLGSITGMSDNESPVMTWGGVIILAAGSYLELWCHPHVNSTIKHQITDGTDTTSGVTFMSGHFIGV